MTYENRNRCRQQSSGFAVRLPWLISLAVPALLMGACSDGPPSGPDSTDAVWSVSVEPDTLSLVVGQSHGLSARARNRDGAVLDGRPIAWSTSDSAIATVDATGKVTAHAAGQATLSASAGGKQGRATLRVQAAQPAAVARIEIEPAGQITIRSASTRQLNVRAFSADGTELFGREVVWTSSDPNVARVDEQNVLKGAVMGSAALKATVEGRSAMLMVEVLSQVAAVELAPSELALAVGEVTRVYAYARDESGNLLNKLASWHSSNPAVATVVAPGRVTGLGLGAAILTATVEGVHAQVRVVVGTWLERQLLLVDGAAPPATLLQVGLDSVGTGTTTWIIARSGRLRLLPSGPAGGRYELRFEVNIQRDGQVPDWGDLLLPGTYGRDQTGALTFRTINDEPLPVHRRADGSIVVAGTGRFTFAGRQVSSNATLVFAGE